MLARLLRHEQHIPSPQWCGKEAFDLLEEIIKSPTGPATAPERPPSLAREISKEGREENHGLEHGNDILKDLLHPMQDLNERRRHRNGEAGEPPGIRREKLAASGTEGQREGAGYGRKIESISQARPRSINDLSDGKMKIRGTKGTEKVKWARKEGKPVHRELRSCVKQRSEVACMRLM